MYDEPFTYYEAPPLSQSFVRELEALGLAPNGKPRFRLSWGMDVTCVRNGQRVPKYVNSKRVVDVTTQHGLVLNVEQVLEFYGTGRWIIEEWWDPEEWAGGNIERAAAEHERLRYKWNVDFVQDAVGNSRPVAVAFDYLGEFERDRYKYLCKLQWDNGEYAQPDAFWLDIVKACIQRKANPRFATIEGEVNALTDEINAARQAATDQIYDEAEDLLKIHAHRLVNPARVNKGGQRADRIILANNPLAKSIMDRRRRQLAERRPSSNN